MNLETAKSKVIKAIKEDEFYSSEYEIIDAGIIETDISWYIPFRDIYPNDEILVGAYNGFIVGKVLGDLHQPGSAYPIEKWLTIYEFGLLGGPHDLIITKIKNRQATKEYLKKLHLSFYKSEIENGTTWKIPQYLTDKMIDERLGTLPCKFLNQQFSRNLETFIEIKSSKAFDYELIKTTNITLGKIGERID